MNKNIKFEARRWIRCVFVGIIIFGIIIIGSEIVVGPLLQWLLHDVPYHLPTWSQVIKMAALLVVDGLSIGTLMWFFYVKGR